MATATPSWNTGRVYCTWNEHDATKLPGTYKVTIPVRVTNAADDVVIPQGVFARGDLNVGGTGASFDMDLPSNQDPDNFPPGGDWKVIIDIEFSDDDAVDEHYEIDVPVGGEVNLRTVLYPQDLPAQTALQIRGVPGGLAELDADGDVIDADGTKVLPGGGGGEALTSYATQVATLADYPTAFPPDLTGVTPGDIGAQVAGDYATGAELATVQGLIPTTPGDIGAQPEGSYATATQGALADTAVQPADLGTAAATDSTAYATAAQGSLADTAVQPADLSGYATDGELATVQGLIPTTPGDIGAQPEGSYATAAQGALADTAVQPADLGTAAATDSTAYATAAQGATADSAVQPGEAEPVIAGAKQTVTFASASTADARPTASTSVCVIWLTTYSTEPANMVDGDMQFEVGV